MNKNFLPAVTIAALVLMAAPASAQIVPDKSSLSGLYTGKAYSPYAHRTFPERPLWGDSHLHTVLSMDAGLIGNRLSPRDAYRFARGEEVLASSGQRVRVGRICFSSIETGQRLLRRDELRNCRCDHRRHDECCG